MVWWGVVLAVSTILIAWLTIRNLPSRPPANLGVRDGRLAACPESPNCVCTEDTGSHGAEPFALGDDPAADWARLKALVARQPGAKIVMEEADYFRAEFTSPAFRFVDDVEFLRDDARGMVHFRSASRTGYSDLGVNRQRMERLRQAFTAEAGQARL